MLDNCMVIVEIKLAATDIKPAAKPDETKLTALPAAAKPSAGRNTAWFLECSWEIYDNDVFEILPES